MDDQGKKQVALLCDQSPTYAAGYAAGIEIGREEGLREASEICKKRADWILTRQDGKPEELSNVILRHHASAHVSAQEEILSAIDKGRPSISASAT